MKNRLSALDGLRGLAAFSVLLSHSGFGINAVTSIPFIIVVYKTLAVGPNSVQILFVLSGFLMALLYPQIPDIMQFIKKRYARIIPVYFVIVIFLWKARVPKENFGWLKEVENLILIAFAVFIVWNLLRKLKIQKVIGNILFFSYFILQLVMMVFNIFILPHYAQFGQLAMSDNMKDLIIGLSNLTLTTPFGMYVPRLSGVFWSLAPEIYFYLIYPFVVIPLIMLGRRFGPIVGACIVFGIIKILFDLDHALISIAAFQTISIARSSGFVVGVVVGTLYQTKGHFWHLLQSLFEKPLFQIIALLMFICIQWGDWAIRDGQSINFMNMYYLISSIVVGMLIVAAIIPRTLTNTLFSNRVLVYLGFISYSMYLIHLQTIEWSQYIIALFKPYIGSGLQLQLFFLFTFIILTIIISTLLFRLVEYIYFQSKQKTKEVITSITKDEKEPSSVDFPLRRTYLSLTLTFLLIMAVYAGSYSPTFLVQYNSFAGANVPSHREVSLINHPARIPIRSQYNNLSGMTVDLRYAKNAEETRYKNKNSSVLYFRLFDGKKKIFESQRRGLEVEGAPRFPLGFPTLVDSKGKNYIAEFELKNGSVNDQVFIDTYSTSLVNIYSNTKQDLLHNPFRFIVNRAMFILVNPMAIFAMLFIVCMMYGVRRAQIHG